MIVATALRIGKETFIGENEGDVINKAFVFYGLEAGDFSGLYKIHKGKAEQGFITTRMKFLRPRAAYNYAKKNGQFINKDGEIQRPYLWSYNLKPIPDWYPEWWEKMKKI